jgi:transcriptional regulator with XRE-family HTH domain
MENLQELLAKKRKELRLSLRDAGKLIGISHAYLSSLEKGIDSRNNLPIKPTPETLERISKAYGFSYEFLMKLAGYLTEDADKVDIQKLSSKLREQFNHNPQGFTLSGEPISAEAVEFILDTLEFGIDKSKKYIKRKSM